MKRYALNKVIVPWDFSQLSESALEAALELVDSPDKIEVVHVTPYPAVTEYGVIWGTFTEENIQDNLAKSFRDEVSKLDFPELKFTAVFGDPGSQITEIAKKRKAGLIVISSHGHTGFSRLLLGSVTERVVRLAHCPVLVLRGEEPEE